MRPCSHRSNFWSIPRVTRFPSSRCPGNLQGNIERGAAWWGLLAAGRVAWVSAGTARPVPKKGELLTCPARADSHAELPPGSTWPHVTGHVGRADEAWLGCTGSLSDAGSAPGWALVESWLARHNFLCWCWSGKDVKEGAWLKSGCWSYYDRYCERGEKI